MSFFRLFQSFKGVTSGGKLIAQKDCEYFIEATHLTELARQLGGKANPIGDMIVFPDKIIATISEKTLTLKVGGRALCFNEGSPIEIEEIGVIRLT